MKFMALGGLLAATAATTVFAQPAPPPPPAAPMAAPGWGGAQRSETRAEVVQRTQAMFARLDRNRDGAITQDELASLGERSPRGPRAPGAPGMAPPPPPPPPGGPGGSAMFDQVDLNHDGVITRDEFAQFHARMGAGGHHMGPSPMPGAPGAPGARAERGMRGGMHGRMLMMADTNRDGRITLQEMTAAALQRFDRMDLNRDGTVTPQERAQLRAQRGAGREG